MQLDLHIKTEKSNKEENIIGLIFLSGLFIPQGDFFYFFVPIVIALLAFKYFKIKSITPIQVILIILIALSFFFYAITNTEAGLDSKALLRNIVIIQLLLLFPFVGSVRITNKFLYFGLLFIFLSQISYMLGVGSIINFFNTYYPYEGDRLSYQAEHLMKYANEMSFVNRGLRLGGLYHNPNQAAKYLNIILAVFIIENFEMRWKSKLPFLLIFAFAIISTGSRTGFFIALAIMTYYIYKKSAKKKPIIKYITISAMIAGVVYFLYSASSGMSSELRFLDYNEGLEKSLFSKINVLIIYISDQSTSVLQLLFGNFSNDGLSSVNFDSEWGEFIYRYGFIFIFTLFVFYYRVLKRLNPENRIIFFVLFWMISSTVILNYRTGFVFMLLLSKYYSDYQLNKYEKNRD